MVALRVSPVWMLLLVVGFFSAALGWRIGAFLMLAWACGTFIGHLVVGVSEYRRVMGYEWPEVPVLPDEDDW
jgi:hypothetical protein